MKAAKTGTGVSFLKAVGMLYPPEKRLFEDPLARKMLTPAQKFFVALMRSPPIFKTLIKLREKTTPGMMGWLFCRFRYIDDVLKECIKEEFETVVNLGAGMDCRACYIPGADKIRYFEIDYPSVIEQKKKKLQNIFVTLPNHVVYVPIDFEKAHLDAELKKAGFDLRSKTLFIWEGVTQYISEGAVDGVLNYVAQAASGSKIVLTYIIKSFIDGKDIPDRLKVLHKYMRKKNNPLWIVGLEPDDLCNYLSHYSLSLIEDIGAEVVRERYIKSATLDLDVFDIERIALAECKPATGEANQILER